MRVWKWGWKLMIFLLASFSIAVFGMQSILRVFQTFAIAMFVILCSYLLVDLYFQMHVEEKRKRTDIYSNF